jgi:hypothetical protein
VEKGKRMDWKIGFNNKKWLKKEEIVKYMCVYEIGEWVNIKMFEEKVIRMIDDGSEIMIKYVCVRLLGMKNVVE